MLATSSFLLSFSGGSETLPTAMPPPGFSCKNTLHDACRHYIGRALTDLLTLWDWAVNTDGGVGEVEERNGPPVGVIGVTRDMPRCRETVQ